MSQAYAVQHDSYIDRFLKTGSSRVVGTTRLVIAQKKGGEPVRVRLALSYMPGQ